MITGAAYYPEHWEKSRWRKDAKLMREMGINAVRMGEFGWSVIERTKGDYDFSLYDEAISLMAEYGIDTILGTPTAAPPAWLCQEQPDLYMEDRTGAKRGFGSRRHYCYNNQAYREYTKKIVTALVRHFEKNSHVIAWQVDNELGCEDEVRCYCEDCRRTFAEWLKSRYSSLEQLNRSWGTIFWSQTYTDWEQIILPKQTVVDGYTGFGHNPGLLLDFARFSSDSLIGYAKLQCDLIRQYTDKPVVHNLVSEFCDDYKLAMQFDRAGYDAYPRSEWDHNSPGRIGFHYDLTRGYQKAPFWILEQQSGPCGWNVLGKTPEKNQLKLWSIQGAARGAEALVYFRWRSCLFGAEQFWYGILDHDGVPRRRFQELKQAVAQMQRWEPVFRLPNRKQLLLVYDYENKFCHEFQPHVKGFDYKEELIRYYEAMMRLHVSVDVAGTGAAFEEYAMVVLPFCSMIGKEAFLRIREYVKNGGILVLTPFSGLREENSQISELPLPGIWKELAGIGIEEFTALLEEQERVTGIDEEACLWLEAPSLLSAESIADYFHYGHGCPAVTVNRFGKGSVYYIASLYSSYDSVLHKIFEREGIAGYDLPKEVECIAKEKGETLILLNHSRHERQIELADYFNAENGKRVTSLAGYECRILKK